MKIYRSAKKFIKDTFNFLIPCPLRTYFVLILLPLLMLNFLVSQPKNDVEHFTLLYQFDNHIRSIRYPHPRMRIYKYEKFDREEKIIYTNLSIYDNGPIGYSLSCQIDVNMLAQCRLAVFSISFGGGSFDNFIYEWRQ